jgi:hypothetical protein
VRLTWWTFVVLGALSGACGGSPPPPAPAPAPPEEDAAVAETAPATEEPAPTTLDSPERSRPPSTATYEQAMAAPESLDVKDNRPHLNDDQLRGPMRAINTGCPLPKNAKVTIHTAVQSGRAIGVTVEVRFDHPPPPPPRGKPKRPTKWELQRAKAEAEREAKAKKKIAACFDKAVRLIVWPPSSRRDSFTTEF